MEPSRKNTPIRDLRTYSDTRAPRWTECAYAADEIIHLTICADRGRPFTESNIAEMIVASVQRCCELCRFRLFGLCLMHDHLHVLLSPDNSGIALRDWLKRFKSLTTNEFVKRGGQSPLWQ